MAQWLEQRFNDFEISVVQKTGLSVHLLFIWSTKEVLNRVLDIDEQETRKRAKMEDEKQVEHDRQRAEVFDALGHPTRILILKVLSEGALGFAELKKRQPLKVADTCNIT